MSATRACEACGGCGYVVLGAGLVALEDQYLALPIREMERRGWFLDVGDGEDIERCAAAFLNFWGARTHADVRALHRDFTLPTGTRQ